MTLAEAATTDTAGPTPIAHLRALAGDPAAQVAAALAMLQAPKAIFDVQAALKVLAEHPDASFRAPLRDLYDYYQADGLGRDVGGTQRAEILRALRPIATRDDVPLLEQACLTEEFLPPGPSEVCSGLRAAGLVALDVADPARAAFHAVRLLRDRYTDRMGGDPALSAARVLAAQGNGLPLYDYVLTSASRVPEVTAACLVGLTDLPAGLLDDLVARFEAVSEPVELAGLFELLMEHSARDTQAPAVRRFMAELTDADVYRYLVTVVVASRRPALVAEVLEVAAWELDPVKIEVLLEALDLRRGDAEVDAVRAQLERRAAGGRRG